ncbi:hypothetical protein [Streptomyces albidus (ex Kaewkla and Franco 2022)]|uniref:hypothetical protein n=1 Tax=Streptomyces albidus (ex Kaewkla and Franco 2022) TaxID=722709 RepID=UPI0015EEB3EC|nr:hypothetical protein [Streptomyces albidus (ex Kaewkla and Franco 2022)]
MVDKVVHLKIHEGAQVSAKLELSQIDPQLTRNEKVYVQAFRDMTISLGVASAAELARELKFISRSWAWRMLHGRNNALPRVEVMHGLHRLLASPQYSEERIEELARKAFAARTKRRIREERGKKDLESKPPAAAGTSETPATAQSSLPVPLSARDRQRHRTSPRPGALPTAPNARQFVDRAATLKSNPSGLLSIVRVAAGELTAHEGAAALHLLKEEQHDAVADPFLEIYAKRREYPAVMETAVVLLDEFHMSDEASTVLRTALKTRAGKN